MTGNVLIKNRTPSSDVPYLFGLSKQKTTLLRRTSVLRSKTLAEGEFTSPEHFNFLPESKKEVTTYVVTSFCGRRGSLAALPCRDTHSGHQTPHWGVFSLRSCPVRPSARWSKKSALLRRTSVLRSKTLAEGEFTSPEHFNFPPESKEVTTYVVTSFVERATRLELATSTLARWRSTR